MKLFCRRVVINQPDLLKEKGPLLLACNHPNSFLDAVILDVLFNRPIWSLARGDVFKSKFIIKILTALRILPVYRVSEGVENLSSNYDTFDACKKLFHEKGIVLIFAEGKCINEWHLRPLKKGTARLATSSWEEGIPLKVLPVGINYSSFRRFGKNIFLNFGQFIDNTSLPPTLSDGAKLQAFNQQLNGQLSQLVYEIDKADKATQKRLLEIKTPAFISVLLAIPALAGWLLHWPLYYPVKRFTLKRTRDNDHYDSVLIALLLFLYPLYLAGLTLLLLVLTGSYWVWLLWLALPFTAWCYVRVKGQLDG